MPRLKGKLPAFSWGLYDFANTIYSMNVVSMYFPLWITVDMKMPDIVYSAVYSGAIITSAFLSPWIGVISDWWKRRKPLLALLTFSCIAATAGIAFAPNAATGLSLFFIAEISYVLCLVLYNSLMPLVSASSNLGRVSGWGVGVGYVGTIVGLIVARFFHGGEWGRQGVFLPTAALFLVFAIPLFLWVKEGKAKEAPQLPKLSFSWREIARLSNHSHPMRWFLLANFLCGDAVHTILLFMSVFCRHAFGFSDDQLTEFLIISTVSAIAGSFFWGELCHRKGAYRVFLTVMVMWCFTLILAATARHPFLYWVTGSGVGLSLGGTWVSSRIMLVELAPAGRVGEYFGLYNLTGKCAAIFGPLLWGALLLLFASMGAEKYRIAVGVQTVFIVAAIWALTRLKKHHASIPALR